jgi:glycosyltransferase involved in cell wall biosynthesis
MTLSTEPFVTVIIPTFRNDDGLRRCLAALAQQEFDLDRVRVLVVDNAEPATVTLPQHGALHVELLHEPQPGSYAARNRALNKAESPIVAFTDSDCAPDRHWIAQGVASLGPPVGLKLVGGRIAISTIESSGANAVELYDMLTFLNQERFIAEAGFAATANLFATRECFDKVGTFNQSLKSGGDREWCNRVLDAGGSLQYCQTATVAHPARSTLQAIANKTRRIAGGQVDLARTSGSRAGLLDFAPPVRRIAGVLTDSSKGDRWTRLQAAAVIFAMKYLAAFEQMLVLAGGPPRR